jgi:hypothetical protein
LIAPIANFFEALATALLEEADAMADVLKFMNIGPHLSLPMLVMNGGISAGGAASMELTDYRTGWRRASAGQLDEDAAYFLNVFLGVDDVFVAQQKAESQLTGFDFGLGAGLEGSVFGPQLFDGVTSHPKAFFSGHFLLLPRSATLGGGRNQTWANHSASAIGMPQACCQRPVKLRLATTNGRRWESFVQPFAAFCLPAEVESHHLGPSFFLEDSGQVMGKRREPRKEIRVPVRIFGTDAGGQIFSEKVFTVNVSKNGLELEGVQAQPKIDEIVGVTYGTIKTHFRVKWVGQRGGPKAERLGLLNLSPEKSFWDFPLPPPGFDASVRDARDRRAHVRLKSTNSAEVYPAGANVPMRTRTADLSLGGCFLEMPNPLPKGTQIRIALWVKDFKLWANAEVVSSTPGFGIGVKFTEMTEQDRNQLKQFIESLMRIRL